MTVQRKDPDRKIIPRFGTVGEASSRGETAPASLQRARPEGGKDEADDFSMETLRHDWEKHRTISFAGDFVSAALVTGDLEAAQEAAEFLTASEGVSLGQVVAKRALGDTVGWEANDSLEPEEVRSSIRLLKRRVRSDPRAALYWNDLARRYAILGQRRKAAQSMRVALAVAPTSRLVLRNAARLNLHLDDAERAHDLLIAAVGLRADPWLVSAEIAMAPLAGRQSRLVRHGKRLLESGQFHPRAVSELASALGTEELASGSERRSRKLFRESLLDPTENAVAQATWAARHGSGVEVSDHVLSEVAGSYEARAQILAQAGDSVGAIANTWGWLRAEPFASNPPVFGSHEAAIAREYEEAISFARVGLVANSDEFLLRNNLVFALASLDRLVEAERELDQIDATNLSDTLVPVLTATRGLVAFRSGDVDNGRQLYREAIDQAKEPSLRLVAALLLAREEIRVHTSVDAVLREIEPELAETIKHVPRGTRISSWVSHLEAETGVRVLGESDSR